MANFTLVLDLDHLLKKRERKIEDLNQFINQNILQRFLPPDLVKDLLAEVFGYDKYAELTSEHAIRGTYCDLAVKVVAEGRDPGDRQRAGALGFA